MSLPPRAVRAILGVAAVALAIAAYLNALDNPFVYDDTDTVLLNRSLVDLSNVRFVLLYSLFRPVVNVSYAIDRAMWGVHVVRLPRDQRRAARHCRGVVLRMVHARVRGRVPRRPEGSTRVAGILRGVGLRGPSDADGRGALHLGAFRGALLDWVSWMPDPGAPSKRAGSFRQPAQ